MAIELGALAIAIRDQGGDQLLTKLRQIDSEGRKVGSTPITPKVNPAPVVKMTDAQRALSKEIAEGTRLFALQARTVNVTSATAVSELRASAAAQREWLVSVGASTEQQLKFAQATQVLERRLDQQAAAQMRAEKAAQRAANVQQAGVLRLTNAQGSLIGAGRASITTLNAVAFAAAQLASTGETSFRSLATAVGSFAAFFGPTGAIVSLVATTGLALTDFFTRRKKEMQDLAQAAIDESRRAAREVQLAFRSGDRESLEKRARDLQMGTPDRQGVIDLREQAAQLQKQIDDKQAELTRTAEKLTVDQRVALVKEIDALRASRTRAVVELAAVEDEIANLAKKVLEAPVAAKSSRDALTVSTTAIKEQKNALDQQIAALKTLAELRQVDVRALQTAIALEATISKELATQGISLEDQAKALERLNALRKTGLLIEKAKPRDVAAGISNPIGPAKSISISDRDRQELGLTPPVEALSAFEQSLSDGIAMSLVNGIAGGFAMGLADGGIAEGFKQLTSQMLSGLGDVFMQVGAKAILGSSLLNSLASGLASLNPAFAIAAGVALLALAKAMGAKGGGSASSTSFGRGASSISNRETLTDPYFQRATLPVGARWISNARAASAPVGPTIEVIGINSPQGQRLIGTSGAKFQTRGG